MSSTLMLKMATMMSMMATMMSMMAKTTKMIVFCPNCLMELCDLCCSTKHQLKNNTTASNQINQMLLEPTVNYSISIKSGLMFVIYIIKPSHSQRGV